MALQLPDEELLRADLLAARKSLDAARDAIANNQVTKNEGQMLCAVACTRYAAALQRFMSLVVAETAQDLQVGRGTTQRS
jgi:hypothetical protein